MEGIVPYTKRHQSRIDRLSRSVFLLDYTLARMNVLLPVDNSPWSEAENKDSSALTLQTTSWPTLGDLDLVIRSQEKDAAMTDVSIDNKEKASESANGNAEEEAVDVFEETGRGSDANANAEEAENSSKLPKSKTKGKVAVASANATAGEDGLRTPEPNASKKRKVDQQQVVAKLTESEDMVEHAPARNGSIESKADEADREADNDATPVQQITQTGSKLGLRKKKNREERRRASLGSR